MQGYAEVEIEKEKIPRIYQISVLLSHHKMKQNISTILALSFLDLPIALDRDRLRLTRYTPLPFTFLPACISPCHRTVPPSRFILAFSDLII